MQTTTTQLGELKARIVDTGTAGEPIERAVVLCHGYGAPGTDLVPLAAEMVARHPPLAANTRFVFPEAPNDLSAFGMWGARAWWMIDVGRFERALMNGRMNELLDETPDELPKVRRALRGLIDTVLQTADISMSQLVLGGFSQGSMLAMDTSLRLEEPPAALLLFSSALINRPEWLRLAPQRKGLRVHQAHGRQDTILPFPVGIALRDALVEAGLDVDFYEFDGVHTIARESLQRAAELAHQTTAPEATSSNS